MKTKTIDVDESWNPPVSSSNGRTAGCCGRTNIRPRPTDCRDRTIDCYVRTTVAPLRYIASLLPCPQSPLRP